MKDSRRKYMLWIAAAAFVVTTFNAGLARGYEFDGLKWGYSYFLYSEPYLIQLCFLAVAISLLYASDRAWVKLITSLALVITLNQYQDIYRAKVLNFGESGDISLWVRESLVFDVIGFTLVTLLFLASIAAVFKSLVRKNELHS